MFAGLTLDQFFWLCGTFAALLGAGYTLYSGARKDMAERHRDLSARVDCVEKTQIECRNRCDELKDELHTDYVRTDKLDAFRAEIKGEFAEVKRDFAQVFDRLNTISENMARYAGRQETSERNR